MGSVEVYDYKRQEWVPYVPDYEKWYQHFKDLRDGYVRPDHLGRYIVGSGYKQRRMKEEEENRPVVQLVTPVAQALEMAKSDLQREKGRKSVRGSGKPNRQRKKAGVKRIKANGRKTITPRERNGSRKLSRKRKIQRETSFDSTPDLRKRYRYDLDDQL